jgi:hypothetical protein
MRIVVLVTVATLAAARDSAAQSISAMAQAIPLVTRADPTAGSRTLTEGYVAQPIIMAHASAGMWRGIATLNFEGLTLDRGELSTGGYGEGYVDRRHPHAYVHELLIGHEHTVGSWQASLFAGRGFVPFGSDDPMSRPFVKYPINHHLSQVLERVVAVGAVRYGRIIGELATFNGDEPVGPGTEPDFSRFGDSWAARATMLPIDGAEVSASYAKVTSPELRAGGGLDQHKSAVTARFERGGSDDWRYAHGEYARTDDRDRGTTITTLTTLLAEGGFCRRGVILSGRFERTDRPEEEPLLDPFRVVRPATDLHNLGVSRWTTVTASVAGPRFSRGPIIGRPFVEAAWITASPGTPPGLFSADLRYGASRMTMLSLGMRLRAGMAHQRMGRYGVALAGPSTDMSGMDMDHMKMSHARVEGRCAVQ